jgi:hypothetical protein
MATQPTARVKAPVAGPITMVTAPPSATEKTGPRRQPTQRKPPTRKGAPGKASSPAPTGAGETPAKRAPSRAAPSSAEDERPELNGLRKLQNRKPPRWQNYIARRHGWRLAAYRPGDDRSYRRSRGRTRGAPRLASQQRSRPEAPKVAVRAPAETIGQEQAPATGGQAPPWLSVVDYVLPQATPETPEGEGPEFVLRAAETYQVTQSSYEY